MAWHEFRKRITRRAVVLDVGGFRPPDDPMASWFGRVSMLGRGESWPTSNGEPMAALAQVNLTAFPFRPPGTADIEFLTVFVDRVSMPTASAPNGAGWCVRTYASLSELVPVVQQPPPAVKPFPMRPRFVEADFPHWEDVVDCPEALESSYHELFDNIGGFKFGGWPSLIQSEISWAPGNRHLAAPAYVFQIDSVAKAGWSWGDSGVGYFGRGAPPEHRDVWALEWQCY